MNFRNDIQGLRALAVLLVFTFHLSSGLMPGGFIGVDMFFIISGYLVTSIVYNKINKQKFSIIEFYEGRIKRIVPAYLFLLLIVSIIASIIFINSDALLFRKSLFWTLLFNSNNYFASLDSYFGAGNNENPLLHTWTLAVEMQFYLILPILLITIRNKKILVLILSMLTIGLITYSTIGIFNGNTGVMYFSLSSRMPEFLIGSLAAIIRLEDFNFIKRNVNILSVMGILAIILSAVLFDETTAFPGLTALLPCLGTLALLMSNESYFNRLLSSNFLVFVGEISYSLYLWHWPIMAFLRYNNNIYEFSLIEKVLITFITIILSLFSYYFVEKTLRNFPRKKFYVRFILLGGATFSMLLLVPKINRKVFDSQIEFMTPSFGMESHGATFKKIEKFGDTLSNNKKILLLGDSHALSMKNYLNIIGNKNHFSFRTITNNTYPTIPGLTNEQIKNNDFLNQYNMLMKHVNKEIPNSDIIILQFAGNGIKWKNELIKLIRNMNESQKLILISDYPTLDKNPVRINKGITRRIDIDQNYKIIQEKISPEVLKIIKLDPRCTYVDLSKSIVFEKAPFYKDTLMYYDQGHLNIYGSKVLARDTEQKFLKVLNIN